MSTKLRTWRSWLRHRGKKASELARKVMENDVWGPSGEPAMAKKNPK